MSNLAEIPTARMVRTGVLSSRSSGFGPRLVSGSPSLAVIVRLRASACFRCDRQHKSHLMLLRIAPTAPTPPITHLVGGFFLVGGQPGESFSDDVVAAFENLERPPPELGSGSIRISLSRGSPSAPPSLKWGLAPQHTPREFSATFQGSKQVRCAISLPMKSIEIYGPVFRQSWRARLPRQGQIRTCRVNCAE
jgi:hypothetical protein